MGFSKTLGHLPSKKLPFLIRTMLINYGILWGLAGTGSGKYIEICNSRVSEPSSLQISLWCVQLPLRDLGVANADQNHLDQSTKH